MQQVAGDGLLPWGALLLLPPWTRLGRSRQGLPTEADNHLQLELQLVQLQLADKHAATSSIVVKAATCLADASVGCKDDNRRQTAFQGSVQVCETLNVQHVHLVDEEHSRHKLSHALVNVSVYHLQPQTKLLLHHETERERERESETLQCFGQPTSPIMFVSRSDSSAAQYARQPCTSQSVMDDS